MKRFTIFLPIVALLSGAFTTGANALSEYKKTSYRDGGVVLRMNAAEGSILNPGEEISFTYQSAEDAYVVLFNIDTQGYVHLISPEDGVPALAEARRTYVVPEEARTHLVVSGETGMEFVFALTIPIRSLIDLDELAYLRDIDTKVVEDRYRIEGDPFLAANIIAGELVRGITHREGIFLDYVYFFVNQRVDYPCYLCGGCDGSNVDPMCDQYQIVEMLDRSQPLAYPLRRAYELIDQTAPAADVEAAYADGEEGDGDRVIVTFYPYTSQVRYVTRPWAYAYDPWYWDDPFWYDPWTCGWVYYPGWRYPYYWNYWSWSFAWGPWGGYYCSGWYYPRYHHWHDYYYHNYYDYAYQRVNYKSAYKKRSETLYRDASSLVAVRRQSVKRNERLRIESKDLRRPQRLRTAEKSMKTPIARRTTMGRPGKTTRVVSTHERSRVITRGSKSTTSRRSVIRSAPRQRTKGTSRTYEPRSRSTTRSKDTNSSVRSKTRTRSSSSSRSYKSPSSRSSSRSKPAAKSSSRSSRSSKSSSSKGSSRGSSRSKSSSKSKKKG